MIPAVKSSLRGAVELAMERSTLASWAARALALLRSLGPYAAIELLLPGGSVLALLLWLYRRQRRTVAASTAAAKLLSC
jgi:hypothetical protein